MTPAVALAPFGVSLVVSSAVLAQQAVGGGQVETLASSGVLAASVGTLVWMVRQFGSGKLVAREPDKIETKLIAVLGDVAAALADSRKREDDYVTFLKSGRGDG